MNKQSLKSIAHQAQDTSILNPDVVVPFPMAKVKLAPKHLGTGNHKSQGEFFKVDQNDAPKPFPSELVPKTKSTRASNRLELNAEVTNYFSQANPDGPAPTKMFLGQKPKRIDQKGYNTALAENLELISTADVGQTNPDQKGEAFFKKTKQNMAKTKKFVYTSKELFAREQGVDFVSESDQIGHLKTKDGQILGEPFVQSAYLQPNEGAILRLDPRIELYKQKALKAREKQQEQREQDRLQAKQNLASRTTQ